MKLKFGSRQPIRPPQFADNRWYSADPTQLKADIQTYLGDPKAIPAGQLIGLVAPHAGLFFSGHVAGASFAPATTAPFKTVFLLGPDHRSVAPQKISTLKVEAWRTPLGDIPVAWEFLDSLQNDIDLALLTQDKEHALEIELPFLQVVLPQFKLAPLMMGTQTLAACRQLATAIVNAIQTHPADDSLQPVLLVASSDLSHYFDDSTARRLDEATLDHILNLDATGLLQRIETGRSQGQPFACGAGPIATVMLAAQALGANQAHLLKYATSADVNPSGKERVVGYAAVAFSRSSQSIAA